MPNFTPIQTRMLAVLQDGRPHKKSELWECIGDSVASYSTIKVHICFIRRKLRPLGQDIVCEFRHKMIYYRQVRMLNPPNKG